MTLTYAYKNGKADAYKQALIERADEFGLNADDIAQMGSPILVRELNNDVTQEELNDIAGTTAGGAASVADEQAFKDAKKISPETLQLFPKTEIDEKVDLTAAKFEDFVAAVLHDIATSDEMPALSKNGNLTKAGLDRVQRALFALAYGAPKLVETVSTSTDDTNRNVTAALTNAAVEFAKVRADIESGDLANYDISAITDAVNKLAALRKQNKPVKDYLNEIKLGEQDSEEMRQILSALDKFKRSQPKLTQFLKGLARRMREQGSTADTLFGAAEPAAMLDLINQSRNAVASNNEADLFAQQEEQSNATSQTTQTSQSTRTEENSVQDAQSRQTQAQKVASVSDPATLHAKFKTDTHPHLKKLLDDILSLDKKFAGGYLQQQLVSAVPRTITDAELARWELVAKTLLEAAEIFHGNEYTENKEIVYRTDFPHPEHATLQELENWREKILAGFRSDAEKITGSVNAINSDNSNRQEVAESKQPQNSEETQSETQANRPLARTTETNIPFRQWEANKAILNKALESPEITNAQKALYRSLLKLMDAMEKLYSDSSWRSGENLHKPVQFNVGRVLGDNKEYDTELRPLMNGVGANKTYGDEVSYTGTHDLDKLSISPYALEKIVETQIKNDYLYYDVKNAKLTATAKQYLDMYRREHIEESQAEREATEPESQSKPSTKTSAREESDTNESIKAMQAALRESSEKIINDAAKNPDVARALYQLGAKIKNGKVTYPDDETFQQCVKLVNALKNGKILAWHGAKADFDVFSNEAAFSGYGEMAHGWGLYFSASPNIAEIYRRAALGLGEFSSITNNVFNVRGKNVTAKEVNDSLIEEIPSDKKIKLSSLERLAIAFLDSFHATTVEEATERAKFEIQRQMNMFPNDTESERKALELIEKGEVKIIKCSPPTQLPKGEGRIYTVAIPNESEMLDEQQDFSEQSPKVHRALEEISKIIGLKFNGMNGKQIYDVIATEHFKKGKNKSADVAIHETSTLLNKNGIKGITYDAPGERDGRCYVVFDDKAIEILKKFSKRGNVDTTIANFVDVKDLNPLQRAYAAFAKEMGVPIIFFRGNKNFHGAHANGISFYNVDATFSHEFVYWHEFGHWLKNN